MKTDLSHIPPKRQRELQYIVSVLLKEFEEDIRLATTEKRKGRIERIILYGSYARDDWKEDRRSGFSSDFDILVVVNQAKLAKFDARWIEKANDELHRYEMMRAADRQPNPLISLIVHSMGEMNDNLRRGRYFFTDIVKDGVVLYEALGAKKFSKPGKLPPEEAFEEAQTHFEEWFESAEEFFIGHEQAKEFGGRLAKSAFDLHQTVEQLYQCILLVLTNYAPASHNIKFLRSQCEQRDPRLIDVWPRATKKEQSHFNKLKEAYVKSRYSKKWKIDAERLEWLSERVQHLQEVAKVICEERLAALVEQVKG